MIPWFELHTLALGPLTIQVWGLCVALGFMLALWLLLREALRARVEENAVLTVAMRAVVAGVIGARLVHVFGYDISTYIAEPWRVIALWQGGLSSFGGLFGGLLSLWYDVSVRRRVTLSFRQLLDWCAYAALPAWILGRVGCVLIHDHPGVVCPSCILATPWQGGVARLDMALMEILGLLPLVLWLWFRFRRGLRAEGFALVFFIYYGALRFGLDFLRARDLVASDARYLGLTPGQYFAILLVFVGVFLFTRQKKESKTHGRIA